MGPADLVPGLAFPLPRCGAAQLAAQVSGKEAPLDRVFTGLWWTGSASSDRPASLISIISKGQLLNSPTSTFRATSWSQMENGY